jgi:hypothetical protein
MAPRSLPSMPIWAHPAAWLPSARSPPPSALGSALVRPFSSNRDAQ